MSVTMNSSRQRSRVCAAISVATVMIGSAGLWLPLPVTCLAVCMRSWTSAMNSWKWARRLRRVTATAKNASISIVLPRPTSP
jgi:hypothetical protein